MKTKLLVLFCTLATSISAQTTDSIITTHIYDQAPTEIAPQFKSYKRPTLYINEAITTHIVLPEHIKLVDISTDKVVGNQCADNVIRLKPASAYQEQEYLGAVTLIGERNIALYDLVYTSATKYAYTLFYVPQNELNPYVNSSVKMPQKDMAKYAWAIFTSGKKFYNLRSKEQGMTMTINNIYSIGDYFFLDFSLDNHTNIKYNIEELRIKLMDRKETKATNSQTIELTPDFMLNDTKEFKKSYRNVIVLKKLTFPEEKVLQLELYESQISGRRISISIAYEDILHADAISTSVLKSLSNE